MRQAHLRVVVVLVLALLATSLSACSAGTMRITAIFDDTGDLQSRGSVQVADVRVGTISRISLTPDFKARVSMAISKGVRIPKASTALLRTTSLLGEKFIELRVGKPRMWRSRSGVSAQLLCGSVFLVALLAASCSPDSRIWA